MQTKRQLARALQKVARVVAEKESTGRHVLLRVSSDRRGRSDHQSEPSEGPYTARTCTQGQPAGSTLRPWGWERQRDKNG